MPLKTLLLCNRIGWIPVFLSLGTKKETRETIQSAVLFTYLYFDFSYNS